LQSRIIAEQTLYFQGAVIVHEVYDNGAAAKDGRLLPGDQMLEVNLLTGGILGFMLLSSSVI